MHATRQRRARRIRTCGRPDTAFIYNRVSTPTQPSPTQPLQGYTAYIHQRSGQAHATSRHRASVGRFGARRPITRVRTRSTELRAERRAATASPPITLLDLSALHWSVLERDTVKASGPAGPSPEGPHCPARNCVVPSCFPPRGRPHSTQNLIPPAAISQSPSPTMCGSPPRPLICACARVRVRLLLLLLLLLGDRRSFLADDFKGFLFLFNPAGRGPSARRSSSTRGWASRTAARTPCSSPTNSTRARSSTAARRPSACGRTATPCSSASAPSRRSSCAGVGVACRGAPPRSQRLVRLRDAERVPDGHDAAQPDPRDGQRRARALGGRAERRRARGRWVTV